MHGALNMLHNFIGYWRSMYAGNGLLSIMRGSLYILCMLFIYVYVSVLQSHRNEFLKVSECLAPAPGNIHLLYRCTVSRSFTEQCTHEGGQNEALKCYTSTWDHDHHLVILLK